MHIFLIMIDESSELSLSSSVLSELVFGVSFSLLLESVGSSESSGSSVENGYIKHLSLSLE